MESSVHYMAYLRKEKEIVELDFPLDKVWEAMDKTVASLEWKIEENDESAHKLKVKTKANFMAYASELMINAVASDEKVTRVTVSAETPVTTITGIVDFGRTNERINTFLLGMVKQLKPKGATTEKKEPQK
jgi:hypothetical protein